ncbi:MAG TPA: nuclear transport factor 2 family protein [Pyrinomonadaceae bacterium]|jgi:ketosteroid isomerase-like protein|nr:nuclear transport factor 2 family protein [Pyrinomonadaceae bacterium]
MFRKNLAPGLVGVILLACIGFAIGFTISYGWIQIPGSSQPAALIPLGSDKDNDGLTGPVSKVQTETAKLFLKSGKLAEGPRELLELTTYDNQGKRVDNSYYLVSTNSQAGKEEYAHDDKGNVSEMTLRDNNNNILSKAVYTYEYDAVGNWIKMVTSTVVYEGGKVTRQPTEVTYRTITYYFDQAIAEIVKSNPTSTENPSNEQSAQGDLASLRGALNGWIAATNARDLEGLMKFYNSKLDSFYRAQNVPQEFVRADKTRSFQRADSMEVSASDPEITMSSDEHTATMRFRKTYAVKIGGRERHGEVLQLLKWQRNDDGWKIVGERDIRILRRD